MDRQAPPPESPIGRPTSARLNSPSGELAAASLPAVEVAAGRIVLDTNAVLDWLVFGEAAFAGLSSALAAGRVHWLSCCAMRRELTHVLARSALARYKPNCERTLSQYDQWAQACADPEPTHAPRLRCRDADDQVFLDLALRERAGWLLTRDRDLLCLARKARPLGLRVATPEAWRDADTVP